MLAEIASGLLGSATVDTQAHARSGAAIEPATLQYDHLSPLSSASKTRCWISGVTSVELDASAPARQLIPSKPAEDLNEFDIDPALRGRIVALSDLLPSKHRNLAGQLRDLSSWDARFDLPERVVSEQLAASESQHELISWAAQRIEESCGRLDIGELVRQLGYSHKHTLRLFNTHIGMSPKLLARLVRFDHLRRAIASTPAKLAELAADFGYSDEAHLIREVRYFAGRRRPNCD